MTGIPQFNYPAFFDAKEKMLRMGFMDVVTPHDLEDPVSAQLLRESTNGDVLAVPNGLTWGQYLARDLLFIERWVGGIALMPGWEKSRGSVVEVSFGHALGLPFFSLEKNEFITQEIYKNYV